MNDVQTETGTPIVGSDPAGHSSADADTDAGSGGDPQGGGGDRKNKHPSGGGEERNDESDGTNEGAVQVTGVLTDEGVECRALRAANGQLYTLAGDTNRFNTGDTVKVTGAPAEMSFCQQGTTLNVKSIEPAG